MKTESSWLFHRLSTIVSLLMFAGLVCGSAAAQQVIPIVEDEPSMELVGQAINTPTHSHLFGYVSFLKTLGINVFSGTTQDESTAEFTFNIEASTTEVNSNGPVKVIHRVGKMTIYLNTAPADFSNPASFRSGEPIMVATYRQQVVFDTTTQLFTTVHFSTILSTSPFTLNGRSRQLGVIGQRFQTHLTGRFTDTSPNGFYGGYVVGAR